jgi:hypothetical protein
MVQYLHIYITLSVLIMMNIFLNIIDYCHSIIHRNINYCVIYRSIMYCTRLHFVKLYTCTKKSLLSMSRFSECV